MSNRFIERTLEQQAEILARNLPEGEFWIAKYKTDTTVYKLLYAMGLELLRLEGTLNYAYDELHITNCQDMITDWETEYGMNGGCFDEAIRTGTLEERIQNILTKIAADGTSTKEQFENLALRLGEQINVYCGDESGIFTFPLTFPLTLSAEPRKNRYIMYVEWVNQVPSTFPFTFPITFGTLSQSILICFFQKLKPANTQIIFIN